MAAWAAFMGFRGSSSAGNQPRVGSSRMAVR
jgi:hypothetical protein